MRPWLMFLGPRPLNVVIIPKRSVIRRFRRPEECVAMAGRVGEITILNEQTEAIDEASLRQRTALAMEAAGCKEFDVGIQLLPSVRDLNRQYRGVDKDTDVLSFPFHDEAEPGEVPDSVPRDDEDLLNLGDILISVPYVRETTYDDLADRGVAKALSTTTDLDQRLQLLIVHGICHLMCYDHETMDEFYQMADIEDKILRYIFTS